MVIKYHRIFQKHFRQRIAPSPFLVKKFKERLNLLLVDAHHPLLRNHRLVGIKSEYYSFSLTGDIRVIYQKKTGIIYLFDVGTHNQVY